MMENRGLNVCVSFKSALNATPNMYTQIKMKYNYKT